MSSTQPPIDYQVDQPESRPLISRVYVALGIIGLLFLAILFILGIVWLARTQAATIEALRDLMIITLAMVSCLFSIVIIILTTMLIRLVNMLEFEIKPILKKTNETLGTVRGTTNFMSENVVRPVTRASSNIAGIRQGIKTLFGDPRKNLPE